MINQFTLVRLKQVAALLNSFSPISSIGSFKDSPELQQPKKSDMFSDTFLAQVRTKKKKNAYLEAYTSFVSVKD